MNFDRLLGEYTQAFFGNREKNTYNIALGFFQKYSNIAQDSLKRSFCDVKLHYKDVDNNDQNLLEVPLLYIGSKNCVIDYELEKGDLLMIFFSDRSLELWKSGNRPQQLSNEVRNSKNHAFALPVVSHHDISQLIAAKNSNRKFAVAPGEKVQIGDVKSGTRVELLDLFNQVLDIIKGADSNGDTYTGTSTKMLTLTQIQTELQKISPVSSTAR